MTSARAWLSSSSSRPSGISETSGGADLLDVFAQNGHVLVFAPQGHGVLGFPDQQAVGDAAILAENQVVRVVGLNLKARVENVGQQLFLAAVVDA